MRTPCVFCPKIPPDTDPVPENAEDLSAKNFAAYMHYLECKATGVFPHDAIVQRNAALIRSVEDVVDRLERQRFGLTVLHTLKGVEMGSLARKDLELRLTMTADASKATAAMQQLAREAERAGMSVKALGAGPPGSFGGGPGSGGLGGVSGAWSKIQGGATTAAGFAAGGAAVISTIGGLHKAIVDLNDPFSTVREKALGFAKALPFVGDSIASFMGSLMDARDRILNSDQYQDLQSLREEAPIRMGQARARFEFNQRMGAWNREVAGVGYNLQSRREFPTLASAQTLLTNSVGGITGSFLGAGLDSVDPRLGSAMDTLQAARRGHRSAELTANASQAEVDLARRAADRAQADWRAARSDSLAAIAAARGEGESRSSIAWRETRENARQQWGNGVLGWTGGNIVAGAAWVFPSLTGSSVADDKGSNQSLRLAQLREKEREHQLSLANADLEAKMTQNKEKQLSLAHCCFRDSLRFKRQG